MPDWSGATVPEALGSHLQSTEPSVLGKGLGRSRAHAGFPPGAREEALELLSRPAGSCCASRTDSDSCLSTGQHRTAQPASAAPAFLALPAAARMVLASFDDFFPAQASGGDDKVCLGAHSRAESWGREPGV